MGKLVVLKLGEGDLESGLSVTLQISQEGQRPTTETEARLPKDPQIYTYYQDWQRYYCSLEPNLRLGAPAEQTNQYSEQEIIDFLAHCRQSREKLTQSLNNWLKSSEFKAIETKLREKLSPSEEIRLIIQTKNPQLRRLPWYQWDLFERYSKAEVAVSSPEYDRQGTISVGAKVKILAILGNSQGINVEGDRQFLASLPDAEVRFLVEPQKNEISEQLWEQNWDIIFFAGHSSSSGQTGRMFINTTENLTIDDLKHGLSRAIEKGLQLAIFNSCDGLKLAEDLAELNIPQIIVMREPVSDLVAQEFLKHFFQAFTQGQSLYLAVRQARNKLYEQGWEDKLPGTSWLPVICQNPAVEPLNWQQLSRKTLGKKTWLPAFIQNVTAVALLAAVSNLAIPYVTKSILPQLKPLLFCRFEQSNRVTASSLPQVEFLSPVASSQVPHAFQVVGKFTNWQREDLVNHHLYLVVEYPVPKFTALKVEYIDTVWVKISVQPEPDGSFVTSVYEYGHPENFSLVLYAVGCKGHNFFQQWYKKGDETGSYPGIELSKIADDAQMLGRVDNLSLVK